MWNIICKSGDYFFIQVKFLKLITMQPINYNYYLPSNLKWMSIVINGVYYLFWHLACLHMALCQMTTMFKKLDYKLDDISGNLMIGSIYIFGYFIMVYFQVNYRKLKGLFKFAQHNFKTRSAVGLTYVTISESFKSSQKFSCLWVISCVVGTLSWIIYPIVVFKRILPLDSWYPFDIQPFPYFEITYFLQFCGQIFVGVVYGISSGIYVSIVIMLCGQFDILFASLKNIGFTTMQKDEIWSKELNSFGKHTKLKDVEINQYYISTELQEKYDDIKTSLRNKSECIDIKNTNKLCNTLADCIRHHTMILEFAKMFKSFYSVYLFCKLFHATFLICFLAYTASIMEASPIKITNVFAYFSLATGELLLLCYYAEQLKRHSVRAGEALMRSNWYTFVGPVQRSMIILLSNATKPIVLSAGNIYNLDIEQFITVMSTAFSYYTLLKNLQVKMQ